MRRIKQTLLAVLLAIPVAGCGSLTETTEQSSETETAPADCVFTQGYWKNHPEEWAGVSLSLGNVTYTQDQLLSIFKTPPRGNGLIQLAHQLIAAKLNILAGGDPSISDEIAEADALIGELVVPPIGNGFLAPGNPLAEALDTFNNNGECAGEPPPPPPPPEEPCCGDGHVDAGEECDDGNTADGDGCSATCQHETPPPPPPPESCCGDGHVDVGEQCDDGNTTGGDGCSSTCQIEGVYIAK